MTTDAAPAAWYSFYDSAGNIYPACVCTNDPTVLAQATPVGHTAILGMLNPTTQHVDLSGSEPTVVGGPQTPAPSDNHVWNETSGWVLTPAAQAAQRVSFAVQQQLSALRESQQDAVREVCIAWASGALPVSMAAALATLQSIETQVTALKAQLAVA